MTITHRYIGIDVSKAVLDIFDDETTRLSRIGNHADAIGTFFLLLPPEGVLVVFEATGVYDHTLAQVLTELGFAFARVNPGRARDFARSNNARAKTDAIDARWLARMGRANQLTPSTMPDPQRAQLARLHHRRDQLVQDRADDRKRRETALDADERDSIDRHIGFLNDEIRRIEKMLAERIAASAELSDLRDRLATAPGLGAVTITTLIAALPELGKRSPKEIAALVGVAPYPNESGTFRGARHISGGRPRVRRALYMAALSAIRTCERFRLFYDGVRQRSSSAKCAIIAVARKLIVALNAMVRTRQPFRA